MSEAPFVANATTNQNIPAVEVCGAISKGNNSRCGAYATFEVRRRGVRGKGMERVFTCASHLSRTIHLEDDVHLVRRLR